MKKKILSVILIIILVISLCGCKAAARNWGSDVTIELEHNQKLEMITWKCSNLLYLTRPMTANDVAETHIFQESSIFGVVEGTVTIIESKE